MNRKALRAIVAGALLCGGTTVFSGAANGQGDAEKIFKANCVLCHGADGSGATPTGKAMKAKDLRSPEVQGKKDAELLQTISKGAGKMPAFEKKLKAEEITSLVAYVRALPKAK